MKWVSIPNSSIRLVEIEGPNVKAVHLQQAQTNMHHEGRQRADQPISHRQSVLFSTERMSLGTGPESLCSEAVIKLTTNTQCPFCQQEKHTLNNFQISNSSPNHRSIAGLRALDASRVAGVIVQWTLYFICLSLQYLVIVTSLFMILFHTEPKFNEIALVFVCKERSASSQALNTGQYLT